MARITTDEDVRDVVLAARSAERPVDVVVVPMALLLADGPMPVSTFVRHTKTLTTAGAALGVEVFVSDALSVYQELVALTRAEFEANLLPPD